MKTRRLEKPDLMTQQNSIDWLPFRGRALMLALLGTGMLAQPFFGQDLNSRFLTRQVAASKSAEHRAETTTEDLHPFTHLSLIPANSDPATIKFDKVKATKVFTKAESTMDPGYCDNLQFNEPGGSMYCPEVDYASPARAYDVTYSFQGEPLASDEYGNRNFTFDVYFRPDELPSGLRKALAARKVDRAELASYFDVTTSRLPVRTVTIDEANSRFCDGYYFDGNWMRNDPNCKDTVRQKTVTVPSDYLTVDIEPQSSPTQGVTASR